VFVVTVALWGSNILVWYKFFGNGMSDPCDCCTLVFERLDFIYGFLNLACLFLVIAAPWDSKALISSRLFGVGMSDACDCCTLGSVSIDIIVVWIWHA
jgi:hypothetical protein